MDLRVQDLSFQYDQGFGLEGLHLNIPHQSFLALIGPNGSGKTTLLGLLSNLLKPKKGEIFLGDQKLSSFSPKNLAQKMAVISSEQYFEFPFLVRDIVAMGRFAHLGRFQKLSQKGFDLIEEAMEKTGVAHLRDRPISQVSSGERQRVLIARALAQKPQILILDEPNAHLDINHLVEIFRLLKGLNQKEELTIIVVLHDLMAAAAFCHTVALLHQGKLIKYGKPKEVICQDLIQETYGAEVEVYQSPMGDYPQIAYKTF